MPAASAAWSRVSDRRVSRPRRKGDPGMSRAAARPSATASSGVKSAPATPRIPSVPNRGAIGDLALRVLRGLAGFLQAVLLAFLLPRVASQHSRLLEAGTQLPVDLDEAAGDAEPQSSRLPCDSPAVDGGVHVIGLGGTG